MLHYSLLPKRLLVICNITKKSNNFMAYYNVCLKPIMNISRTLWSIERKFLEQAKYLSKFPAGSIEAATFLRSSTFPGLQGRHVHVQKALLLEKASKLWPWTFKKGSLLNTTSSCGENPLPNILHNSDIQLHLLHNSFLDVDCLWNTQIKGYFLSLILHFIKLWNKDKMKQK